MRGLGPIEIIESIAELPALKDQWNDLASRFRYPTLRFEWIYATAAVLPKEDQLKILVLRDSEGVIEAIAPMVLIGGESKMLTLLGNRFVSEPASPLFRDSAALHRLIHASMKLGLPMKAARMPSEIVGLINLRQIIMKSALPIVRPDLGSPLVDISGSWEKFESGLSSRRRSDIRRAWRRAEQSGTVTFRMVAPSLTDVDTLMEQFFEMERSSWKASAGTATYLDPYLREFFLSVMREFSAISAAKFCFMLIDGKPVAGQMGLEYAGSFWILKIAYRQEYRSCSPGVILMHETLREAFSRSLSTFEFLGFEEAWMKPWETRVAAYGTVLLYPYTLRGTSALVNQTVLSLQRRLMRERTGEMTGETVEV